MTAPLTAVELSVRRTQLERTAALLFVGATLFMAIICGAIITSGWFAGVIEDQYERIFWLGAVLSGLMVACFAGANLPGGRNDAAVVLRVRVLLTIALTLFVVAPTLCVVALALDFFR